MALWTEPAQKEPFDGKAEGPEQSPAREIQAHQQKETASGQHSESVFAPGLTIEGKIQGAGNVRIAGRFKGDIDVKGNLSIERGAHIDGQISAQTVTIEGELDGNVTAGAQVKLLESGQVVGELKARTLTVAAGSRMRGTVDFGWEDSQSANRRDAAAEKRPKESSKPVESQQKTPGSTHP